MNRLLVKKLGCQRGAEEVLPILDAYLDVSCNTLLYAQRRELNLEAGGWYEAQYDLEALADFFPLLVYHFCLAEAPDFELLCLRKSAD